MGYKKDKALQDLWRAMDAGHLAKRGRGLYGPLGTAKSSSGPVVGHWSVLARQIDLSHIPVSLPVLDSAALRR